MQNLNVYKFRCPDCQKLYEADSRDIQVHNPQFECVSCRCRFGFFVPPVAGTDIKCFIVSNRPNPTSDSSLSEFRSDLKRQLGASLRKSEEICPKCGTSKFEAANECYSCGVIFSKLEGLPDDQSLRAQPSLVRKWKDVLQDYSNDEKHELFFSACQELGAVAFASFKYQEIKALQGQDVKADEMLARMSSVQVGEAAQLSISEKMPSDLSVDLEPSLEVSSALRVEVETESIEHILNAVPVFMRDPILRAWVLKEKLRPLQPYLPYTPYMISVVLILWGIFSLGNRNTVGLGVAIAILSFGWKNWLSGKNYSS